MKTVRVRIMVAVDPSGSWSASGWGRIGDSGKLRAEKDAAALGVARDGVDIGERHYALEVDLELPQLTVVEVHAVEQVGGE